MAGIRYKKYVKRQIIQRGENVRHSRRLHTTASEGLQESVIFFLILKSGLLKPILQSSYAV